MMLCDCQVEMFNINDYSAALLSGATAGLFVDIVLFPIDTIKTRLQSKNNFFKAGGFHRLYSGIGAILVGSVPGAAMFFVSYEGVRKAIVTYVESNNKAYHLLGNISGACIGEITACFVRVPVEVVKQRSQVNRQKSSYKIFYHCLQTEGIHGLYRGYKSTLFREIPFSIIQFPLWEFFKKKWTLLQKETASPLQSACCGFFAGGIAAAATTPLDVAKTRIMLAQKEETISEGKVLPVLYNLWKHEGLYILFSGIFPRMFAISAGGFIFLGTYEFVQTLLKS